MIISFEKEQKLFESPKKRVYVFYGQYEFLQNELAWKIARFLMTEDEIEMGLHRFSGSDDHALSNIADAASEQSLFSNTKLIFVTDAEKLKLQPNPNTASKKRRTVAEKYSNYRDYERLVETIAGNEDVYLIFLVGEALRTPPAKKSTSEKVIQRCLREIDENGAIVEFPRLFDNQLLDWVRLRARTTGISWTPDQSEMFMEWAGKDVRHLSNEIEKISVFFNGQPVDTREMRRLVTSNEDFYMNYLMDFMLNRRAKAALRMLEHSFERGAHAVNVTAFIAARLRLLWQARYLLDKGYFNQLPAEYRYGGKKEISIGISKAAKIENNSLSADPGDSVLKKTPFAVYHLLVQAKKHSLDEIEEAIRRTGDADCRLKGILRPKHGSDEIMIESLVVDIASKTA